MYTYVALSMAREQLGSSVLGAGLCLYGYERARERISHVPEIFNLKIQIAPFPMHRAWGSELNRKQLSQLNACTHAIRSEQRDVSFGRRNLIIFHSVG